MGTGNDFARGNGIPLDIEDAARLVLTGEPRKVDLLVDETGTIVVNNVHVGVGAQASRKGHKWKTTLGAIGVGKVNLGKLGYPIGAAADVAAVADRHHQDGVGDVLDDLAVDLDPEPAAERSTTVQPWTRCS